MFLLRNQCSYFLNNILILAIRTHARWHGDDLIIDGSKHWITNGNQADWICLLANTNQNSSPYKNKSLICVPLNEPGSLAFRFSFLSKIIRFCCNTGTWQSCFLILLRFLGIHRTKKIEKLGMLSSDTAEIYFDAVRIPSSYIIGEEGHGFFYQMMQFQDERLVAVAVRKCIVLQFHNILGASIQAWNLFCKVRLRTINTSQ